MNIVEIKNAIIESVVLDDGDRGFLTAWLTLDYGGVGQGFGGHVLYLPKEYMHHTVSINYAGHFIFRCMQIAGVTSWDNIKGKSVRVKCEHSTVHAIGHIVKDDWFDPAKDFELMRKATIVTDIKP